MTALYPLVDALLENHALHCASLVIAPTLNESEKGLLTLSEPSELFDNGTITFIETAGKTYGITCWHVVQSFRKALQQHGEGSHSMRTMVNGQFVVLDRFMQPQPDFGQPKPDIAIRAFSREHIERIGKKPMKIDEMPPIPDGLKHAIAVGFPTELKKRKETAEGTKIAMPHVRVVAELRYGTPTERFTMFSDLEHVPETTNFSGASGGPIFWCDEEQYGILGIIYESGGNSPLMGDQAVHICGEFASPDVIRSWVAEYERSISTGQASGKS